MGQSEDIDEIYRSLRRKELDPLEKEQLIPTLDGNLRYLRDTLIKIQGIARDVSTDQALQSFIAKIVPRPTGNDNEDAREYLRLITTQIEENFVEPINEALNQTASVVDQVSLRRWLMKVGLVASTAARNKDVLFVYEARAIARGVDRQTQAIVTKPIAWSVTLYPFEVAAEECARVASGIQESIAFWNKNQQELVLRLADLRAAEAGRATAKRQFWAQIVALGLAVMLSFFVSRWQDALARVKERRELEWQISELQRSTSEKDARLGELIRRLEQEQTDVANLKAAQVPATPAPRR